MEALLFSTVVVALAEMGDKTQLLSFVLAVKLRRKVPIAGRQVRSGFNRRVRPPRLSGSVGRTPW